MQAPLARSHVGVLGLVVVLLAVAVVSTPWSVLGEGAPEVPTRIRGDFGAAEIARQRAYHAALAWPTYLSWGLGVVVLIGLGLTRWGTRLLDALAPVHRNRWGAVAAVGALALLTVVRLVQLPFDAWAEVVRRDFGLSTRAWASWWRDVGLAFVLDTAITVLLLVAVVGLIRRWPPRWGPWWGPAAAAAAVLVVVGTYVWPVLVEPMFNRFRPLPAGQLRSSLLDLAEKGAVPVSEVLVADASRRTTALNAYVSGLGDTRRLVLYDTLLASAEPSEVEAVVAHEFAHVQHHDVRVGAILGGLTAATGTMALGLVLSSRRIRERAGVTSPGDPKVVVLVLAAVTLGGVVTAPAENLISRQVEARADVAGMDLTEDPETFAAMQRQIAVTNLADLDPPKLAYVLFASHPTSPERIALARSWALLHGMSPLPPLER